MKQRVGLVITLLLIIFGAIRGFKWLQSRFSRPSKAQVIHEQREPVDFYTIVAHDSYAASLDGLDHYAITKHANGKLVRIKTRCAYTQYKEGSINKGFCPSERLPALGVQIPACTPEVLNMKAADFNPRRLTCIYRAGDYLVFHLGGIQEEEDNLLIEAEY